MESPADTFGSEEVSANPLLGLTHLRERITFGVSYSWQLSSENSCVLPPLDKWGALTANPSVTMKEFTAGEEKVAWGDLFLSSPSFPLSCQLRMFLFEEADRTKAMWSCSVSTSTRISCGCRWTPAPLSNHPDAPMGLVNPLIRSPAPSYKGQSEILLPLKKSIFFMLCWFCRPVVQTHLPVLFQIHYWFRPVCTTGNITRMILMIYMMLYLEI